MREHRDVRTLPGGGKVGLACCQGCGHVGPWHRLTKLGWRCETTQARGGCGCRGYDPGGRDREGLPQPTLGPDGRKAGESSPRRARTIAPTEPQVVAEAAELFPLPPPPEPEPEPAPAPAPRRPVVDVPAPLLNGGTT